MLLSELYEELSYGDLRASSIALSGSGDISDYDKSRIIVYVNRGLRVLYTRFSHKLDYVKLQLQTDKWRYQIHPRHAVSNTDPANTALRYLIDDAESPFSQMVLRIRDVTKLGNADDPNEYLPINKILSATDARVARMVAYDTIEFTGGTAGDQYLLELVTAHPRVAFDADPDTTEIEIFPALEEALCLYVASKTLASIPNEENRARAAELLAEYEEICQRVKTDDMLRETESFAHSAFSTGGWR